MIKIERKIPIPLSRSASRQCRVPIFPLHRMKVGDSFKVDIKTLQDGNRLRARLTAQARRLKIKIVTRQIVTGKQKRFPCVIRVWRIK